MDIVDLLEGKDQADDEKNSRDEDEYFVHVWHIWKYTLVYLETLVCPFWDAWECQQWPFLIRL